jgi:hypothetical protein
MLAEFNASGISQNLSCLQPLLVTLTCGCVANGTTSYLRMGAIGSQEWVCAELSSVHRHVHALLLHGKFGALALAAHAHRRRPFCAAFAMIAGIWTATSVR